MDSGDVEWLRKSLRIRGLEPVSLSGHCDLATQEGVELFKARINLASELEIAIVNTGTAHSETPEAAERFFQHMNDVIPYAQERGVRIALETHGGLTGTSDDCLRTLDRLGSDWVGINYDTANVIYYRGVRPEEDIKLIAPRVIHVHLKDKRGGEGVCDFPPLGKGTIDFTAIVETLDGVGYTGPYSAEIEFEDVESPEAEDAIMGEIYRFMAGLLGKT
jgi:inosose dehydratase